MSVEVARESFACKLLPVFARSKKEIYLRLPAGSMPIEPVSSEKTIVQGQSVGSVGRLSVNKPMIDAG